VRRSFLVLAACVCLLVVAACGSKSAGKVAEGTGAEIAPADSIAFVSVDVDRATGQWHKLAGLLDRVTGLSRFDRLVGGACLRSIPSVLGKTIGVAVLPAKGGSHVGVVLMTRPASVSTAKRALAQGIGAECAREIRARVLPAKSTGVKSTRKSPQLVLRHATREIDGWLLISDSSATLDRFKSEAKRGRLADSRAFRAAFAASPENALVRAYLSGEAVSSVAEDLGGDVSRLLVSKTKPDWVALSARTAPGGFRLDGTVSGIEAGNAPNSLIGEAPTGSRLALSFNGSSYGLDKALEKLTSDAKIGPELARIETYLGLKPDDLAALTGSEIALFTGTLGPAGENAIAVDPSTGRITGRAGFGLELRGAGASETARKIERGLPALASFLKGGARRISLNGVGAQELTLGALRFFFAGIDGKMLLSADANVIGHRQKLSSARVFRAAKGALRLPAENAGVLFARLDQASQTTPAGSTRPAGGLGLGNRSALLVYLDASGSTLRIHGVLAIR
jgi:hypothetical protein